MARLTPPTPDLFPQIWDALTIDRIVPLLEGLRPRPRSRHIILDCPACGRPEAYLYEPKGSKCPHIHCNRQENCGHNESLWNYVKRCRGDDGKAALAAISAAAASGCRRSAQNLHERPRPASSSNLRLD